MFKIETVSKQYDNDFILKDISFMIHKGLTFITGPSGSGKTTLLKIIGAMESEFTGNVFYCGKDIKCFTNYEKGYFYNHVFGFVGQDFNLVDNLTVLENILLPNYLKEEIDLTKAKKIIKDMKLNDFIQQKIKYLSGGQKQRVAIARELMKSPDVIFADEPTSALDEKTSREVMDILRTIAKTKTVIVVTHDTSLIKKGDQVFELDKGELSCPASSIIKYDKNDQLFNMNNQYSLSFYHAVTLAKTTIKRCFSRFTISLLTLMIAAVLLLTTFSGAINKSGQQNFDRLLSTYGEGILDISIVGSFMSAGGTTDEDDGPNADVNQDISGLYEKYINDPRIQFAVFSQAFDHILINIDNHKYEIESTGSVPILHKLLSGKMPDGNQNEVVVPESFVKKTGFNNENIIGKEMIFSSSVYNWDTGKPIQKDVKIKVKITGVADNTSVYEYQGEKIKYSVDDSFFFSQVALKEMRRQANFQNDKMNFVIRAKTPADMISLKDELNKTGIVPLGQFELVEDMVRLNMQTNEQAGSASIVIGFFAIFMTLAVSVITNVMRKREYAIYKINGFGNGHLNLMICVEILMQTVIAIGLFLILSPLINNATISLFHVNILTSKMLLMGIALIFGVALLTYIISILVSSKTNLISVFKTGDKS